MNDSKPLLRPGTLFAVFTVSGFSGLIYESIWSHYLKLLLGHAAYAQTLVLAIFMGGMAIGAWLAARRAAKLRNLLVGYAIVEIVTGLIALAFHPVYVGIMSFTFETALPALGNAASITAYKWTLGALLILPQSILLGTTFPLISGGVIRRFSERVGETLATLYFTNSIGAACGVLASGFVLIGAIGLPGAVITAGVLNVLLGAFVWSLARASPDPAPTPVVVDTQELARSARWILAAAFLAGVASFVYEIAWIRMLAMVLGSSTHAFELMLSAFIAGLAFGGLWIKRRIDRIANPARALGWMFAIMALTAVATVPAYDFSFMAMSAIVGAFTPTPAGYAGFNVFSHVIAAATMIPTSFVAGMTLPLLTRFLMARGGGEPAIGKVYALNTLGAIVGSLIAIHVLFGAFGLKGTIVFGAVLQLLVAVGLPALDSAPRAPRWFVPAASATVIVLGVALFSHLDPMRMAAGVYRHGIERLPPGNEVTYLRDGKTATISLHESAGLVTISTNGKPDASIDMHGATPSFDEVTMTLAAALPLALHDSPRRVANIGIGSGLTSHVVLASPDVQSLDSIEIEAAIIEAARRGYGPRVRNLYEDPRSHIHVEDAKTWFVAAGHPYDVIISEPSNPWVSGVATLFSDEFYRHIVRFLEKDGLLVQWVQIYETDPSIVASILKALSPHFADYALYNTDDANLLIVATPQGKLRPLSARVFDSPQLKHELDIIGVRTIDDISIRQIGTKATLEPLFASYLAPRNSDYHPFVDLTAPRMRFLRRDAVRLTELHLIGAPVEELLGGAPAVLPSPDSRDAGYFQRSSFARLGLAIAGAWRSHQYDGLDANTVRNLLTLRAGLESCGDPGVRAAWLQAASSVANQTVPYLPAEQGVSLWRDLAASKCFAQLTPGERSIIEFHGAVAARDRPAIARIGSALLADRSAPLDDRITTTLATASALVATGDGPAAIQLIATLDAARLESTRLDLAARLVAAHAARVMGVTLAEY